MIYDKFAPTAIIENVGGHKDAAYIFRAGQQKTQRTE